MMPLPIPKIIPDVGQGGGLLDSMNALNDYRRNSALANQEQIKAYYQPDQMRLANELSKLRNQYYGPNIQSEINNRNALTQGQNITNQYLPDKLRLANALAEFKNDNPLMSMPGAAGQVGTLNYLRQHPELPGGSMPQRMPDYMPGQGGIPYRDNAQATQSSNQNNLADLLQSSIESSFKPKGNTPTKEFKNAQAYEDAKAGYVPFTNRMQKINTPDEQQRYMSALTAANNHTAIEKHQEQLLRRKHWDALPTETKSHLTAIAQGGGIRGDQVEKWMGEGKDFDDLLYSHGIDPNNPPEPIYELTKSNVTAQNNREYASREIKYLSDFINKATGNYARKIANYSPSQVRDALAGRNEEQQAKFLAARGLSPELVNLRLVLGNAKPTVHAIKSMTDKSMLNNKIFESLVSNKAWHRSQEIMDDVLQKAFVASKKGYGAPAKKSSSKSEAPDFKSMTDEELRKYIGE